MRLFEAAGKMTAWRGYQYYKQKKVLRCECTEDGVFEGEVSGKTDEPYRVRITENAPDGCHCSCPFTGREGRICKHMVALSFAAKPDEAQEYYEAEGLPWLERQRQRELRQHAAEKYVAKLDKIELQQLLLSMLLDGSPMQLDRFLQEHLDIQPWDTL